MLHIALWQRSYRILRSIENTNETPACDAAIRIAIDAGHSCQHMLVLYLRFTLIDCTLSQGSAASGWPL